LKDSSVVGNARGIGQRKAFHNHIKDVEANAMIHLGVSTSTASDVFDAKAHSFFAKPKISFFHKDPTRTIFQIQ
jgi:hypothetical protein